MSEIIKIENLNKTFGRGEDAVVALDGINLSIEKGEIFGVIGLSGAGKSTLVRCINLLERPTHGHITVNGFEMTELSDKKLLEARRGISMIFQGFNLLMQRTALENVCFPLEISGVSKKQAKKKAIELLATVGLDDRANAYPAQLSGGQKQRVAIARALATDPSVLLCDEATSALDPTTTESILDLIRDINRKTGITVVIITHEMRVIQQICSRVAIISQSGIAEIGPVEQVFVKPQTKAAKELLFPKEAQNAASLAGGRVLRLVFDGSRTDKPIVASMVLRCGEAVNIIFADTKIIDGKLFGQMIVQLPQNEQSAARMCAYLDEEKVNYEEENANV